MNRSHTWLILFGVIILGAVVRLYALGSIPHGLAWDEAAIGYNGNAVIRTRRDEWLQRLPVSFRSFGDYKAPLAVYVTGLSTVVFGLNPFAVRLPFAIAGTASIFLFALVTFELWRNEKNQNNAYLFAALLLATTPWHIHYSRVGFESGIALFFVLLTVYGFLRFVLDQRIARQVVWVAVSAGSAVLSLYTYHSAKITVPVLLIGLAILYRKRLVTRLWGIGVGVALGSVALYPLLRDSFFGEGLTRANVTLFSQSDSLAGALLTTVQQILVHLQYRFLVLGQTTSLRHGDGSWGVLLPMTYLLVLLAFGFIAVHVYARLTDMKSKILQSSVHRFVIAIMWIGAGVLPAAIGSEVPHSNRALLALPGFLLLAVEGMHLLWQRLSDLQINRQLVGSHGEKNLVSKAAVGVVLLLHLLIAVSYVHQYFTVFAADSAQAFSDGYIEAFTIARQYERGVEGKPEVETIIFSDAYGQPYIYALFTNRIGPESYNGGALIKYQFAKVQQSDLYRPNALVVATPSDGLPIDQADHTVFGSDGGIRFLLYRTPK